LILPDLIAETCFDLRQGSNGISFPAGSGEDPEGPIGFPVLGQPPGTLGNSEHADEEEQRGHGGESKHPSPADLAVPGVENVLRRGTGRHRLGGQPIDRLDQQDADNNGELVDRHQFATHLGGCDLRDIIGERLDARPIATPPVIRHRTKAPNVFDRAVPSQITVRTEKPVGRMISNCTDRGLCS
jgi:hypothetical protein